MSYYKPEKLSYASDATNRLVQELHWKIAVKFLMFESKLHLSTSRGDRRTCLQVPCWHETLFRVLF
jgi:hypothetical protein